MMTRKMRIMAMVAAAGVVLPFLALAEDTSVLDRCASIDDDAARLSCYDDLSAAPEPAAEPEVPPATPSEAEAAGEHAAITDDYGAEMLDHDDSNRKANEAVRATVTACRKDVYNDYYFFFENGQVWKQKDDDRLRYKECEFGVTVTKDAFGYKMQVDGKRSWIRIGRIR